MTEVTQQMKSDGIVAGLLSGLIGALAGAVIGAYATYKVQKTDRAETAKQAEVRYVRQRIRNDADVIVEINNILHYVLVRVRSNNDMFITLRDGILGDNDEYNFNISSALLFDEQRVNSTDILNSQLDAHWSSMYLELGFQNSNIEPFNNFYKYLFNTVHESQLNGSTLNKHILNSDNKAIKAQSEGLITSHKKLFEKAIEFKAMIGLYAEQWRDLDFMSISPEDIEEYRKELVKYEIDTKSKELNKRVKELTSIYTANVLKVSGNDIHPINLD